VFVLGPRGFECRPLPRTTRQKEPQDALGGRGVTVAQKTAQELLAATRMNSPRDSRGTVPRPPGHCNFGRTESVKLTNWYRGGRGVQDRRPGFSVFCQSGDGQHRKAVPETPRTRDRDVERPGRWQGESDSAARRTQQHQDDQNTRRPNSNCCAAAQRQTKQHAEHRHADSGWRRVRKTISHGSPQHKVPAESETRPWPPTRCAFRVFVRRDGGVQPTLIGVYRRLVRSPAGNVDCRRGAGPPS